MPTKTEQAIMAREKKTREANKRRLEAKAETAKGSGKASGAQG